MILSNDEIVTKVFNNNIILVNSEDHEKILFAKGIGFGKKPGYVIPKGIKVDKIFTIADSDNIENLNTMIEKVDNDFFVVCEEAIYEISEKINQELNMSVLINIHHVDLALKYADRVIGIKAGEIVYDGPSSEVTNDVLTQIYGRELAQDEMMGA